MYFSALKDRSRVAVVTASVAKIVTKLKQPDIGICPTYVLLRLEVFLAQSGLFTVYILSLPVLLSAVTAFTASSVRRDHRPAKTVCTVWLLPARCRRIYCCFKKLVKTHLAGRQQPFDE